MTEAVLPIEPHEGSGLPEISNNAHAINDRITRRLKRGIAAATTAFRNLKQSTNVDLTGEETELNTVIRRAGILRQSTDSKLGMLAQQLPDGQTEPEIPASTVNPANDQVTTSEVLPERSIVPELREHEGENRRPAIRDFAIDFIYTLNPGSFNSVEHATDVFDAIEVDIFTQNPQEIPEEIRELKGFHDMIQLTRYYDTHYEDTTIPQSTVVLSDQTTFEPFDNKVLVYVEEFDSHEVFNYYQVEQDGSRKPVYRTDYDVVKRPKKDKLSFTSGDGKVRPDVYLKSISDKTELNWKKEGDLKGERLRKKEFSIEGSDAVIIGGRIQPEIPVVTISCTGPVTVLEGASLTPAPIEGRTSISIHTPANIEVQSGAELAASQLNCDTFIRNSGAEIVNPHPSQDLVHIECNQFRDVPASMDPLNPQLFDINDQDYKRRQENFWGVIHEARMAQGELAGSGLEGIERSEQVSELAVNFLYDLNKGRISKERLTTELFGRGATGTRDIPVFLSSLERNIAAWEEGEAAKPMHERAMIRGVQDMFKIVEYYMTYDRTLPGQIVILGKDRNISRKIKNGNKALVYWADSWDEEIEEDEKDYTKAKMFGQVERETKRNVVTRKLGRSNEDQLVVKDMEQSPDLFISNFEFPKISVELGGFENIIVGGIIG